MGSLINIKLVEDQSNGVALVIILGTPVCCEVYARGVQ